MGPGDGFDGKGFSAEQLRYSWKDARILSFIFVGAFLACVGVASYVFANVPWDTRMPYDGRYNQAGTGIPMQIALLPVLVPILGFWRAVRRPEKEPRTKAGRVRSYVIAVFAAAVCIFAQWTMAGAILVAGGAVS